MNVVVSMEAFRNKKGRLGTERSVPGEDSDTSLPNAEVIEFKNTEEAKKTEEAEGRILNMARTMSKDTFRIFIILKANFLNFESIFDKGMKAYQDLKNTIIIDKPLELEEARAKREYEFTSKIKEREEFFRRILLDDGLDAFLKTVFSIFKKVTHDDFDPIDIHAIFFVMAQHDLGELPKDEKSH